MLEHDGRRVTQFALSISAVIARTLASVKSCKQFPLPRICTLCANAASTYPPPCLQFQQVAEQMEACDRTPKVAGMHTARSVVVLLVMAAAAGVWFVSRLTREKPSHAAAVSISAPSAATETSESPAHPVTPRPHLDPDAQIRIGRQLQEASRGYKIVPAANADLTKHSLAEVVAALRTKADAGDAAANRQLSDIYRQCAATLYAEHQRQQRHTFQLRESASAHLDPAPEAVGHCRSLDADAVRFFGDPLLAAAAAGDAEARLQLRYSVHAVSGGDTGVLHARALALAYLKALARDGVGRAWYALAEEASNGRLLPRDSVLATAYYTGALLRAADPYDRRGIELAIQTLSQRLTPEELRRGERMSGEASILD